MAREHPSIRAPIARMIFMMLILVGFLVRSAQHPINEKQPVPHLVATVPSHALESLWDPVIAALYVIKSRWMPESRHSSVLAACLGADEAVAIWPLWCGHLACHVATNR